MASDVYAYLSDLSAHPDRTGDTSNLNPLFAAKLAAAIQDARAQGLDVGVMSAFREPGQTGSAYDAGGNSSHSYGLASDISGLDGANGPKTKAWASIAAKYGLYNPYGIGDSAEYNHWQYTSQPLEKIPGALDSLKAAKASGNMQAVWSAAPSPNASGGGDRQASAGPKTYTSDQVFNAIFGQESNYGRDPRAGGNVLQIQPGTWANYAKPGEDINNRADNMAVGHRIIDDYMSKFGGDPAKVATAYFSGPGNVATSGASPFLKDTADASGKGVSSYVSDVMGRLGAPTGTSSPAIGTTLTSFGGGGAGVFPGTTQQQSNDILKNFGDLDKALGGQGIPGQPGGEQPQAPQPPPMMPAMARNVSPLGGALLPNAPQMAELWRQKAAQPMQWSSAPQGASPYANVGLQTQPSPYGTTLTSMMMNEQMSPLYSAFYGGSYG